MSTDPVKMMMKKEEKKKANYDPDARDASSANISMEEKKDEDHHHHHLHLGSNDPNTTSPSLLLSSSPTTTKITTTTTRTSLLLLLQSIISSGLSRKSSPLHLSSWIQTSLTLDGRDKITKVIQYTSRLLSWYYFSGKNNKFKELQTSLTQSRKSFRLGRSVHELYKLYNVGWQQLFWFHFCRVLYSLEDGRNKEEKRKKKTKLMLRRASSSIANTPVIMEEDDEDDDHDDDETKKNTSSTQTTKPPSESSAAPPPRLHLPRRVSADIGWGPASLSSSFLETEEEEPTSKRRRPSLYKSLSDLGGKMYRPLSSFSSSLSTPPTTATTTLTTPPTWKLIGTTLKLLGLAGFFLGDNLSYLSTFGFLDAPYNVNKDKILQRRKEVKRKWAHFAMKSYFMACCVGLVLNGDAVWRFWNDTLKKELDRMLKLKNHQEENGGDCGNDDDDDQEEETEKRKKEKEEEEEEKKWEEIKGRQFVLLVALFKSCCDIIVFSNNPGVDLHQKYRGKKMNEGFHSLCGILSASTVLYNNFPNSSE